MDHVIVSFILLVLAAKAEAQTQGNLTDDEAHMLKNILYELRMIYVKEKR